MAVELKNRIDVKIAVPIPVMRLLKGPSLAQMSVTLYESLQQDQRARAPDAIESLSEAELDVMIQELRA